MSSGNTQNVKNELARNFGKRLKEAFQNKSNADIARSLGVSDSAVTTYMNGRVPSAQKLIKISNLNDCNLHWLLTGQGERLLRTEQNKTKTLLFQGGKGGSGTTTAAMLTSVTLAAKGFRTILVGNPESINFYLFSLDKNTEFFSKHTDAIAKISSYCKTSIENLDIFIRKGCKFNNYENVKVKPFNKSNLDIQRDYDFIIFDIHRYDNPFISFGTQLDYFLIEAKLIIPYQPLNSTLEIAAKVLAASNLEMADFPRSFLGLFINNDHEINGAKKLYERHKKTIQETFRNKMFQTTVRHDFDALENFIINTEIDKLKKTNLFADYSNLVDEILFKLEDLEEPSI